MRKLMAVILTIILLAGSFTAVAEVYSDDRYETLTVGVTTAFSGTRIPCRLIPSRKPWN